MTSQILIEQQQDQGTLVEQLNLQKTANSYKRRDIVLAITNGTFIQLIFTITHNMTSSETKKAACFLPQ